MPLDIPRMFMQKFGQINDLWYDPYMGTGTTAIAAANLNRKYLGFELQQSYIDLAKKRIEDVCTNTI